MSEPVRCAVVGLGWIGSLHARFLASAPNAELVACCDRSPAAAAGYGAAEYESLSDALAAEELQAVFVCTPPEAHCEVVLEALAHDLNVLCEKPLAHDLADVDAMIAAERESEGRLVVGHLRRFDPRFAAVAEAVADGRVGTPLHLWGSCNCPREDAERLAGGTTLALESAIHDLDAMRWLAGEIDRVYAAGIDFHPTRGPDALTATIHFESGAVGAVCHSWAMPDRVPIDWEFRFQVGGEAGLAEIDGRTRGVTVLSEQDALLHPDAATWPIVHRLMSGALALEDAHFLVGVAEEERVWPLTLADARAAVAAALALDLSIAEGRPVSVSELG